MGGVLGASESGDFEGEGEGVKGVRNESRGLR